MQFSAQSAFRSARVCELAKSQYQRNSALSPERAKVRNLAALRQSIAQFESASAGIKSFYLPLGVPEIHRHLPVSGGLAAGTLHEIAPVTHGDGPAALGFLFALTAIALGLRPGPAVFIATRRALADWGKPYGHGLHQLGVNVDRLIMVETRTHHDALWAIEETLRSDAGAAIVAGAVENSPNLTASRRLNLAAGAHAIPLVLLRRSKATVSAAASRWHIASAPAAHDAYGDFAYLRWRAVLDRARNGRPGEWLIEWDHVAHRFRLVEGMADRAPVARAGLQATG
jgi:protein ImuA